MSHLNTSARSSHSTLYSIAFVGASLFLMVVLIWLMQPILIPLIIAGILYSLLEPITNRMIGNHYSQLTAISLVLLGVFLLLGIIISLLFPILMKQILQLQSNFPVMLQGLTDITHNAGEWLRKTTRLPIQISDISEHWLSGLKEWGTTAVMSSAGFIIQAVLLVILVPLISFFLLRDYRRIRNNLFAMLPNHSFEMGWITYHRVTRQLQRYVKGVVTQSLIVALIASVGFYFVGLDMAILFGCLAGLLNVIPYIGPLIAAILPILVSITSGTFDLWLAFGVLGVILLVQVIDNVFIIPSVIANSIGLHPLLVLFGVIIFGSFFGLVGMLLAIPILASVKIIVLGLTGGLQQSRHEVVSS